MLDIVEVLQSSAGLLVGFQVPQTDQVDIDAVDFIRHPLGETFVKADTRNGRQHFDAKWRHAHSGNFVFLQKQFRRGAFNLGAEKFADDSDNAVARG